MPPSKSSYEKVEVRSNRVLQGDRIDIAGSTYEVCAIYVNDDRCDYGLIEVGHLVDYYRYGKGWRSWMESGRDGANLFLERGRRLTVLRNPD